MQETHCQPRGGERGIALLLVIWTLALLSAIAVAVTADGRSSRRIAQNVEQAARDRALAEGGLHWGIAQLLDGEAQRRLPLDGRVQTVELDDGRVQVAVEAETGKFDINISPPIVLQNLLLQAGATPTEARRVAVEADTYRKLNRTEPGRLHRPAFLETLDLRRVTSLDEALYRRILPFITVYSGTPRLDPAVSPRQVLMAVPGLSERGVDMLLLARQQTTNVPAPQVYGAVSDYLGPSRPVIFTIRSTVQTGTSPLVSGSAIVEISGRPNMPIRFHDWFPDGR